MEDTSCLFSIVDSLRVIWEITHLCNYNCLHCCAEAPENQDPGMEFNQVIEAIDNLVDHGLNSIYFSGGEPLLRKDMFKIIDYAAQKIESTNINIATNGKIITPEMAEKISEYSLGSILVSLDGHNPELAHLFRGVDCFDNSVNAVRNLAEKGQKVRLGVVIWKENYEHLEDFVKIGYDNGADNVFFNWLVPIGVAKKNPGIQLDPESYFVIGQEIKELKEKYSGRINVGYHRFEEIGDDAHGCQATKRILHILPDGIVSPCSWIYKADKDIHSMSKIFEKPLHEIISELSFFTEIIKQREDCGPGCPAMCKIFSGDYNNPDPNYRGKCGEGIWIKNKSYSEQASKKFAD